MVCAVVLCKLKFTIMKRHVRQLLVLVFSVFGIQAGFAQETIDLSTGVSNSTGSLFTPGTLDDTWRVQRPGNTNWLAPKACTLSAWQESACSRWVSLDTYSGEAVVTNGGTYTYRATFTVSSTRIDCASLEISHIGGDNRITGLQVNGYSYYTALNVPAGDHFSPLLQNRTIILNTAHLNPGGTNTVTVTVSNGADTYAGFNMCGSMRINNVNFNIDPNITGPSAICQGNPLAFGGSLAPGSGVATDHLWGIQECDASGTPVAGGFSAEYWFNGPPSNYTFPSGLNLTCNRYYNIRLAAVYESTCDNWAEERKLIYYSCNPVANAGPDRTICEGECTTIGALLGSKGVTYTWTAGGATVGSGALLEVCPVTNTTYTVTATNQYGCTAMDQVTVTVSPNDPRYIGTIIPVNSTYFNVEAEAVYTAGLSLPGFMFDWMIEELNTSSGNTPYYSHHGYNSLGDNSCWWPYPTHKFKGFVSTPGSFTQATPCNSSSPDGKFLYGRTYRITRTTWTDACDPRSYSLIFSPTFGKGTDPYTVSITEDPNGPQPGKPASDMGLQPGATVAEDAVLIYPNPGNGIFNIMLNDAKEASIEVFDLFGKKIQSRIIAADTHTVPVDLSAYAKGMYTIHITRGGQTSTHKVILQ